MGKIYNFAAGPAILPKEVLATAANEMLDYHGTGMSVMEMSHRSSTYDAIIVEAETLLRELLEVPDNYKVLFLQGGASTQFAMVPLNLMKENGSMDIALTGVWAQRAKAQAEAYGKVNVVASSEDKTFNYIPELDPKTFNPEADYFHITSNNTIYGTRITDLPDTGGVPLVSDMSSYILSEVFDMSKYGIVYAGAQKNIGPSGVTVVIVREDLIGNPREGTPIMLNYETHSKANSLYNTPPTYAIYISMLVFRWLKALGGVPAIQQINEEKAALLYDYLDESSLFSGTARREDRSLMNIPFVLSDENLNERFLKEAADHGLVTLKGHRSVGGMRASIYNAMPLEGVKALVGFMKDFEVKEG